MIIVGYVASCTQADPQPTPAATPAASSATSPAATASPTPSTEDLELRRAEKAVVRFWRVIDRLSADPESDLTDLTTVARGSVATQWARNINQYRYDGISAQGRVAVLDPLARQTAENNRYVVKTCIDSSKVHFVDKEGKSVGSPAEPRRVSYDYTVEKDRQKWYVTKEKATETC